MVKSGKRFAFLFFAFIVSSFFISLVSAQYYGSYAGSFLRTGSEQVIDGAVGFAEPFLQVLLGGQMWNGYYLFEALILFIILVSIVYLSLNKVKIFDDNKGVLWIVCIAVPLLGIRFIDIIWFNTIIIQYKVLAIALTAGLPFIIYFFFLYNALREYDFIRKVGWIFFAVIFLGVWATSSDSTYGEVYVWTAAAAFLFFLFDGVIKRTMIRQMFKDAGKKPLMDQYYVIQEELKRAREGPVTPQTEGYIKQLLKNLKHIEKELAK